MKLVGAMHAAIVMAARKAATVVHKVMRNVQSKATLLRLFTKMKMRKEGNCRVEFVLEIVFGGTMVALSSSLQMNCMFSYYHRKKFYKLQNSNIMVLYEIGGRYACSYRHGCAKSRYRRAQSGAQRAKQSKAKQRYYVSSPKRKCARKESSVSRGELSSKQLVACWHTYC